MEGTEQPNHVKIRTLGERKIYKFLQIVDADTIKHTEMKIKEI